jgi:hypothetical protein
MHDCKVSYNRSNLKRQRLIVFQIYLNNNLHFKEDLYLYDLITGKKLRKFNIDIGTITDISARKKDDFVINN